MELAEYCRDLGYMPEQVQDFYPTPSTLSTVMYYTGLDPRTMEPVYVPTDPHEKAMQRALIQYRDPKNYALVHEALEKAHRTDLIGFDAKCLIRPRKSEKPVAKQASAPKKQTKQPLTPKKQAEQPKAPTKKQTERAAAPKKPSPAGKRGKQPVPHGTSKRQTPAPPTAAQLARAERYLKSRKK